MSLNLVDWADLGPTVAIIEKAMLEYDVCSPVAVEVVGIECGIW